MSDRIYRARYLSTWHSVELDGLPPCDGETVFVGINTAGFAACFNEVAHDRVCSMQGPEICTVQMSGLNWWRVLDRPDFAAGAKACCGFPVGGPCPDCPNAPGVGVDAEPDLSEHDKALIERGWQRYSAAMPRCAKALPGWRCTRAADHDGPCAAEPSGVTPAHVAAEPLQAAASILDSIIARKCYTFAECADAAALVLRFHGIADAKLLTIAAVLESVAADSDKDQCPHQWGRDSKCLLCGEIEKKVMR